MLRRTHIVSGLLMASLLAGQALADKVDENSHLSYYTYYKTRSGETVSGLAGKFGLAESSLRKMNPQLTHLEGELPVGSLICVPKEEQPPELEEKAPKVSKSEKKAATKVSKKKRKKKRRKKKEREEPSDAEWETLAELATKGAPAVAARRVQARRAPDSKLIRPDGSVVWVPAARSKPAPKPKVKKKRRRVKLSSRKGKAIHGLLKTCRSYMGTPYVWGGELPGGFDCSGYVQYVFAKHGYRLPRTADIQYNVGNKVTRGEEKPGDLVFFETYAPGASHVGVYLGRGYFIHASSSRGVTVDRLATEFFAQRYLGAKRQDI